MSKPLQIVFALVAVAIAAAIWLVAWEATRTLQSIDEAANAAHLALWNASAAAYEAQPAIGQLNGTLEFVNRPCASVDKDGHLLQDGPICEIDQAIRNIRKITTQSGKQVEQTGELTTAAANAVASASADVHRLALAGTDTLGEGKRTIAAAQPLLASLTRTSDASTLAVEHFDALIQSPDLSAAISNVQETTQNVAGVTLDLRKVADKTTEDYLKPKTPWSRITHGLWNAYDLAAFTARHY